jgi:hypothetical protein
MSKLSLKAATGLTLALAGILWLTAVHQVQARPQYLPVWLQTYPDVAEKNNVKAMVKCNVCHFGAAKKNRNEYGKAIEKSLEGKKNLRDKTKFADVLKTAAKEKNGDGKYFGELLDANELPAKGK